jgi:hypothetical protein
MPMNLPPSGGLPSPMTQAPANAGAATMPQANAGNVQAALTKVKAATKMLQEALPLIPIGSEKHLELMEVIKKLSKAVGEAGESPQQESAALQAAAQNIAKQAPQAAMAKMFGAQQGAGQPPATQAA